MRLYIRSYVHVLSIMCVELATEELVNKATLKYLLNIQLVSYLAIAIELAPHS